MPQVGFEPTMPVFERVKTVHVLDRAAPVVVLETSLAWKVEKSLIGLVGTRRPAVVV
jgi:hypothetical protein